MTSTPPISGRKRKASSTPDSPSKRARYAEGLLEDPTSYQTELMTGQIKRISLVNWVTFDSTVIDCEPGLNLIVGPNGTGKSSIVCAIGLGLAGKPASLGRGEKPHDFIKYNRQEASIEIELYNEETRNDVIKRLITKKGSQWKLNNKTVNQKVIHDFVRRERNIKVDNLCQFLAQDRVSEFARLSPVNLLLETEKAIENDELYRMHKALIEEGEKAETSQSEITALENVLNQARAEIDTLKTTIQQFAEKNKLMEQKKNYEALKEWMLVQEKKREYQKCIQIRKKLERKFNKKKQNVAPVQKEARTWNRKSNELGPLITAKVNETKKCERRRNYAAKQLTQVAEAIKEDENRIQQANQDVKARQKRIKKITEEIQRLQRDVEASNPDQFPALKEERLKHIAELKKLRRDRNKLDNTIRNVISNKKQKEHELKRVRDELDRYRNTSKQREQHIFNARRSKEKEFKMWVESNRSSFRGDVFGPIVNEMNVRDDQGALFLNAIISQNVFYGYVCTDGSDWDTLVRKAGQMGLQITVYTSSGGGRSSQQSQSPDRRPVDPQFLQQNGVDGYLDQLFDAPEIIKQTLNDQMGLNQLAFSRQEPDHRNLDTVLVTRSGERGKLKRLITPQSLYQVKESHYDDSVLRSMNPIRTHPNPILRKTPDYSAQIADCEARKTAIHESLDAIQNEHKEMNTKVADARQEIALLQGKKQELDHKISTFNSTQTRLSKKKSDLEELEQEHTDPVEEKKKWEAAIQDKNLKRLIFLETFVLETENMHKLMMSLNCMQCHDRHCKEEFKECQKRISNISNRNNQLRQELDASRDEEKMKKRRFETMNAQASQRYPQREYKSKWTADDKKMSSEDVEERINRLDGRINVLFIDPERVQRYKRLEQKISKQAAKLEEMLNKQNDKEGRIQGIESKWKPQLLDAVKKISIKFGEFFRQFNNAEGKVELVSKDEASGEVLPYSEWCIDISTKFRADQPWKRLTSSSQSGGEKSVSTMLYLLSLQQVTTVPFRVVDEINQGMDPHNERRIMQILNYECTPKRRHRNKNDGGIRLPQYFVVTPKLLPRLEYSPCSSVYVIFNGPFQMPQEYWKMDSFLQSQKTLSQSPPRGGKSRNRRDNMRQDESEDGSEESEDTDQE